MYFKSLNIDIQDITAGHFFDYVNYLSIDGGRKGNKIGGQSATSIRKITIKNFISISIYDFIILLLHGICKHLPDDKFHSPML